MSKRSRYPLWWIAVTAALVSFGCPKEPDGPPAEHVAIAEGFCHAYWEFRCRQFTECDCGFSDYDVCLEGRVEICTAQVFEGLAATKAVVGLDAEALEECRLELGQAQGCGPMLQGPAACLRIPRGEDDPCVSGLGCGDRGFCGDAVCVEPAGEGEDCSLPGTLCDTGLRCDGVCVHPALEGSPCQSIWGCATGLACIEGSCFAPRGESQACDPTAPCGPNLQCTEGACVPAFEPCDLDSPGESCGIFARCLEPSTRECRLAGDLGAGCVYSMECGHGEWCDEGQCTAAAEAAEECSDGVYCRAGLACLYPETVCGDIPGEGDACALTLYGPTFCGPGLGCLAGVCGDLPQRDEVCTVDYRCAEPWGCSFERDGSFCRTRRGAGEPCENDQVCTEGTFCDYRQNQCAVIYPAGAECSMGNECGPDRSCLPEGNSFVCSALPGEGQRCLDVCVDGFECVTIRLPPRCIAEVCLPSN